MAKYIKTGTTEFEQFDGSDEIIEKYDIRKDTEYLISDDPLEYQIAPYQIESLEGWLNLNVGDWIATGVEGEHWPVKDEIFQKVYKKLPVLNKGMARWLELTKQQGKSLGDLFTDFVPEQLTQDEANMCMRWVASIPDDNDRSNAVARAWLDGYEVAGDSK